jgi:predicted Zn-dependent protease with MMP-like domain
LIITARAVYKEQEFVNIETRKNNFILMDTDKFSKLVVLAVANLPTEFRQLLDNVDIVVEKWPSPEKIRAMGLKSRWDLLGLYEGVPQTQRTQGYNLVLPDKITIYQKPIEAKCNSLTGLKREITRTVRHEIAHHFGLSDARLRQIERRRKEKQY